MVIDLTEDGRLSGMNGLDERRCGRWWQDVWRGHLACAWRWTWWSGGTRGWVGRGERPVQWCETENEGLEELNRRSECRALLWHATDAMGCFADVWSRLGRLLALHRGAAAV